MKRKYTERLIITFFLLITTFNMNKSFTLSPLSSPNDPNYWTGTCISGQSQSPIAYYKAAQVKDTGGANPLRMTGSYGTMPTEIKVVNSGYDATYTMTFADGTVPQITGGPLGNDVYNFVQFHYHWPCEHKSNFLRRHCNLETHVVHYNAKYASFTEAKDKPDGLAVIGLLFKGKKFAKSPAYMNLVDKVLPYKSEYIEKVSLFTYADAVGFATFPQYITYKGSLTVPSCAESVTWIVVDQLYNVNFADIFKARQLLDRNGQPIASNSREVQPINGRIVRVFSDL